MASSGIAAGLQLIGAMAILATAAGCQDAAGDRAPPNGESAITVVLPREALEIDPRFSGDAYGHKVSRLLFASLLTIDPQSLEVVPDLAQRVETLSSARYRVRLKPNLTFSDGSALDADDVISTFRGVVAPELGSRYAHLYRRVRKMVRIDELTVEFQLDGPHATFLTDLELPVMRSQDERRHVGVLGEAPPIGAGPYRLLSREPGRIELAANPHWYAGRPRFPRVTMVTIRDDNTRALRLLAGAGDLALNAVPPLLVPLFLDDERFQVSEAPGVGTTYLGFNTEAKPLQDPRVRLAIAHAIDRQTLIDAKFGGRARLARGFVVPGHWAFSESVPLHAFDPAAARELLREAGYDGGRRLALSLRCGSDRFRQSVARAIGAMLRRVGVQVEIRPSETATLIADLNRGRFELTMLQVPELVEPHFLSWFFASEHVPGAESEGANRWRYRSPEVDAALEAGRSTVVRAERREAYVRVQQILARDLPVVPLWHEDVVAVTDRRAGSFAVPRLGRFGTLAR